MIVSLLQNLESVFGWLLTASWQASVLVLLVLLLQWALRGRLNPRWHHALWLLVVLRLILPVLPESALSLFQFTPRPPPALMFPVTEPMFAAPPIETIPQSRSDIPDQSWPFSLYTLLAVIWLAGALGLLVLTWQVNRRFARQARNSPEIDDGRLLEIVAAAKMELGVHRHLRLIESTHIQGPAIMGLFHPTLILPVQAREKFTDAELRFIFLHELAHLKRGDLIVQWLVALLQILHWFNPVLWFAFRRMRADREPATDALVLSRTGEADKERYGLILIKLLEHFNQRHSLPTLVGILEDKDQFKRRFLLIGKFTRSAYGWSLLGMVVLGALAVACLTKAKAAGTSAVVTNELAAETSDKTPAKYVRLEAHVMQIGEDDYQAHRTDIDAAVQKGDSAPLSRLKSFNLLPVLVVLTKAGEQAVMEHVRVLPYPIAFGKDSNGKMTGTDFKRQNLGVRFVLKPTFTNDKINVKGYLNITSLEGWDSTGQDTYKPIFHSREMNQPFEFESGQTIGVQVPGGAQMEPADPTFIVVSSDKLPDPTQSPKALRRIFLFLSASSFSADGKALPSPTSAQINDQKFSRFVEKVNAALRSPDSKEYKNLFFEKDISEIDQVALNARFESLMISLVGNSDWKIKVIPAKEIPPETNTDLNLKAVWGLEIQNAEKDTSHRVVFPVGLDFGEYFIAESKTPGPGALMLEAVQKGDTAALQKLFDQGVDPNVDLCNPVYWAVYYNQPEILKLLLAHNAETNRWSPPGDTSPIQLARMKHPELASILQAGIDRNHPILVAKLEAQLKATHIDLPAFSNAPLDQVISSVIQAEKKANPLGQGINFTMPASPVISSARITLSALKDVSILDALQALTHAANLKLVIDEIIRIEPPDAASIDDPTNAPDPAGPAIANPADTPKSPKADTGTNVTVANTQLLEAVRKGDAASVQKLLKQGADPNTRSGDNGDVPLFSARDAAMVDLLIANGADPKLKSNGGNDALDYVCWRDPSVFEALIRDGVPFDVQANGPDKLVCASESSNIPLMTKLLALGVDPNTPGAWFRDGSKVELMTPLNAAVNSGRVSTVTLLLDHGAKTEGDKAKIMVIAVEISPDVAKLLWSRGNRDVSPLLYAISQGASVKDIAKLLDEGSPVDPPQDKFLTPLGAVARKGNLDLVKLLVERGADVNTCSFHSATESTSPVALAAFEGEDEVVGYLLAHGAKPDPTALYEAARNSTPYNNERTHDHFEKTVRLLLDAGALKIATPEEQGAIVSGPIRTRQGPPNATVLKMILDAGANPNTPMPYLVENGEKPNTVIGYYRDYCAQHRADPGFGTGWMQIKPLLDMLEAADKGTPPKMDAAVSPPPAAAAKLKEHL